jgi:glutamate synthase domain-containing protein 2
VSGSARRARAAHALKRYGLLAGVLVLTGLFLVLGLQWRGFLWLLVVLAPAAALGLCDLAQREHSLTRNYPILARVRWLFEGLRPYLRQYIVVGDLEGRPIPRHDRTVVYERAKNTLNVHPFGTELDPYSSEFEWIAHSIRPTAVAEAPFRITIGGPDCAKPYSASVLNISAMSFGSLGAHAVEALNLGAKLGNFFHDTGEGGICTYHRRHGGDLVWEIGSGYFGCRDGHGNFDPGRFADQAASDQVKMIEIKLSQGAKPGHGGMLPAAKVTAEIAAARGVPEGRDCISPSAHSAFSSPAEMMEFIAQLRELSGGKPVGFKLCVGHPWEFLAICKAILKTGIKPDFITVDGAEGGTGAAPQEFTDHVGAPLRDGLILVQNTLVGTKLRRDIRLGASGKIVNAFTMASNLALGADWCNSARAFMFALGCVMSMRCHTDRCPTGVTTHDPLLQRGLVVGDKAERVRQYHDNTLEALSELVAAAGLMHPDDLRPHHVYHRVSPVEVRTMDEVYTFLEPGALLDAPDETDLAAHWRAADADSFAQVARVGPAKSE